MPTVTGLNIPGYSKQQHVAEWSGFFSAFPSASCTVSFGGNKRTVRWVDKDAGQLGVLDESHGEIEILDRSARHLGIMQIEITYEKVIKQRKQVIGSGRTKKVETVPTEVIEITQIALRALQPVTGGKAHQFTFQGTPM
ncbi:MAG: hypothetical protein KIT83_13315 [Bryobacterales bacterium]|nr:hypothetical protein [Bryobacterales bacterium]